MANKNQPAEVFVFRQENALLAACLLDKIAVTRTGRDFAHSKDIEPFDCAQGRPVGA